MIKNLKVGLEEDFLKVIEVAVSNLKEARAGGLRAPLLWKITQATCKDNLYVQHVLEGRNTNFPSEFGNYLRYEHSNVASWKNNYGRFFIWTLPEENEEF